MPTIPYRTSVGPGVASAAAGGFAAEVDRVLADPRGWKRHGFEFRRVPPGAPALRIRLETSAASDRDCRSRGFSCYRPGPGDIVIHEGNWMGGSASTLPLERYRNYVINHESGHSLGLPHRVGPTAECARRGLTACPASIMQQATRGPAHLAPCIENDWPWPPGWGVDEPPARPTDVLKAIALGAILLILAVGLAGAWRATHVSSAVRGTPQLDHTRVIHQQDGLDMR
jgi:hypothetical protein